MLSLPFGGLFYKGGSGAQSAQALTTTGLKITAWAAANGGSAQGAGYDGDPAVVPDPTNNQIKVNTPGLFYVTFSASVIGGAAGPVDTLWQLRVNSVVQPDLSAEVGITSAQRFNVTFSGFINVLRPASGNLATFPAPSGTFTGGPAAPFTETTIDIFASTVASSITANVEFANFSVLRVG